MKIDAITEKYIRFDNGNELTFYHDQDCCEQVYADFKAIKDYNTLGNNADKTVFDLEFPEDLIQTIEHVENLGFKFNKVFVPCHNIQNGFYNSELELIYHRKDKQTQESIDISKCVKDEIYD